MTIPATRTPSEFAEPSTLSERNIGLERPLALVTGSAVSAAVVQLVTHADRQDPTPADHVSIEELASRWSREPDRKQNLEHARRWVADTFYTAEGDTLRTLRLRKGMSQSELAAAVGTSQPHIARIERGTENVTIDTCRRLVRALDIDMNALDAALARQEQALRDRSIT